jgi:hypothetical protein
MTDLESVVLPGGSSQLKSDGTGIDEKHEGIFVLPTEGFVIKTKSLKKIQTNEIITTQKCSESLIEKVFINVCYHDAIEKMGTKKKLDENGKEVEGLNLPLAMGPTRTCQDKSATLCIAVDAIVHPSIKDDIEKDLTGSKRDFVCQVLLQCFDQKHTTLAPLDRKYKLPRMKYFGYIDVKSGQITRKASENTELCKQYVRNAQMKPKIEEVACSSPSESSRSSKLPPLSFEIAMQSTNGDEMDVQKFLSDVCGDTLEIWDGSIPLCIDHDANPKFIISKVILVASVPGMQIIDLKSINVQISAFTLYVTSPNCFGATECNLPMCVDNTHVQCFFDQDRSMLKISATVLKDRMDDCADIGSQPWLIAKALSIENTPQATKKAKEKSVESIESVINSICDNDDPYLLKSPFPWKNQNSITSIDTNNSKLDLPEDQFHSKDSMSQHIMQQQEEERQEKVRASEEQREQKDNTNYMNVEDFKPGGKYSQKKNADPTHDKHVEQALRKAENLLTKLSESTCRPGTKDTFWCKLF